MVDVAVVSAPFFTGRLSADRADWNLIASYVLNKLD
jgi:hypothetical protein